MTDTMMERSGEEEWRLPVWLGSAVVQRTGESTITRVRTTVDVEVHVYRFRRPKRFPLTRNLLLKLIDMLELQYRYYKGKGNSCCSKFGAISKGILLTFNLIIFYPFMLVMSPFVMIYEMIGADEAFLEESDLYEREWFRIDHSSWCLLLLRQCLETDPVEAGHSPGWVSVRRDHWSADQETTSM
jgi:hypothetical protein